MYLKPMILMFAGASAGHYTAFAKHPRTSEWYNYNDETTTKKPPQEEDYSNGYILFYQRENLPDLFT
jgi:ubiquitin C-terminal hydrolase